MYVQKPTANPYLFLPQSSTSEFRLDREKKRNNKHETGSRDLKSNILWMTIGSSFDVANIHRQS